MAGWSWHISCRIWHTLHWFGLQHCQGVLDCNELKLLEKTWVSPPKHICNIYIYTSLYIACSSEALCINPAIQNTILASWFAFDCLGLDAIGHFQDGNIWKDGGIALGDGPGKFANVKM